MDRGIKCNDLDCFIELQDEAVVTSCSHQYCRDCANRAGLLSDDHSTRVCPACATQLPNELDIFCNNLNPSEEWKANILSGLSPGIIIECAGKALSFWAYQMVMEMACKEAANRRLAAESEQTVSKYERQLNEHKATLDRLSREVESRTTEVEQYRQSNEMLSSKLATASSKAQQFQKLYETLKRNATLEEIQHQVGTATHESGMRRGTTAHEQQPVHQPSYPTGTVFSPQYTHAQPAALQSLNAQFSPRIGPGVTHQTGEDQPYSSGYREFRPQGSIIGGSNLPGVQATPRSNQRHRGSGPTGGSLAGVHGVVAGTPRPPANRGTPRVNSDPSRQYGPRPPQQAPVRFPGVALGPIMGSSREGPLGNGSHSYESFSAPSINSRGTRSQAVPPVPGFRQSLTAQRPGAVAGSRNYGPV